MVKISVLGGDGSLHNFIGSYVALKVANPKLFETIEVQLYMLPAECNDFSIFLSKYDGWYGKQIFLEHQSILRLYPTLAVPQSKSSDEKAMVEELKSAISRNSGSVRVKLDGVSSDSRTEEDEVTPPSVLRSEVENLFREAKWKLDVRIKFIMSLTSCKALLISM